MNLNLIESIRKSVTANNMASDVLNPLYPEWYQREMTRLGEKYRNIRWLPLDIPQIKFADYDEFLRVWDENSIDVVRVKPCTAEPWTKENHPLGLASNYYRPQFKGLHIFTHYPDTFEEVEAGIFAHRYFPHPVFEPLVDFVKTYYPFHLVHHIYIWESVREVYPHRDQTMFWNCPTEFRAMLHDENEEPTLYVADVEHGDAHFVDLSGLDTNAFCWSNGSQIHGSDYYGKRKQLLCINGILSVSKLEELLDRSIEKYKDKINYKLEI